VIREALSYLRDRQRAAFNVFAVGQRAQLARRIGEPSPCHRGGRFLFIAKDFNDSLAAFIRLYFKVEITVFGNLKTNIRFPAFFNEKYIFQIFGFFIVPVVASRQLVAVLSAFGKGKIKGFPFGR
jgi:hypothetical protein